LVLSYRSHLQPSQFISVGLQVRCNVGHLAQDLKKCCLGLFLRHDYRPSARKRFERLKTLPEGAPMHDQNAYLKSRGEMPASQHAELRWRAAE